MRSLTKETISDKLLEVLLCGAATMVDIAWLMATSGANYHMRIEYFKKHNGKRPGRELAEHLQYKYRDYKQYHALLHKMEKQGLVETNNEKGEQRKWFPTKTGMSLSGARKQEFKKTKGLTNQAGVTIISYDIPERMRRERGKMRDLLKIMDFEQVHQSVWFGSKRITKQFLQLLRERRVLNYVHIFEVSKTGTLKDIEHESTL